MTDDEKRALEARIQAATKKVIEEEVETALRASRKDLDRLVRDSLRATLAGSQAKINIKVQAWLDANLDQAVAVAGKQMVDEAIGAIRRRVLGRDG